MQERQAFSNSALCKPCIHRPCAKVCLPVFVVHSPQRSLGTPYASLQTTLKQRYAFFSFLAHSVKCDPLPALCISKSGDHRACTLDSRVLALQAARGSGNSMGSSMEEDGFVIVNAPSPSSSGHQPM